MQTRLEPLDQHGKLLGVGDECIERWPKWLPKDWRIAYFKEEGHVKRLDRKASLKDLGCEVLLHQPAGGEMFEEVCRPVARLPRAVAAMLRAQLTSKRLAENATAAEQQRMQRRKRLRRMDAAVGDDEPEERLVEAELEAPQEPLCSESERVFGSGSQLALKINPNSSLVAAPTCQIRPRCCYYLSFLSGELVDGVRNST